MAVKRKGYELSPISMLLEEFDATQNRLARENRLMEKRLAKQAKRERAQKLRKLAERARSAHELAKSEDKCPSPGSRVIQIETAPLFETTMSNSCHDSVADTARDPSTSPDSVNFRLSQQWRHKDSRLDKVSNSNHSGELEMRMGMMERNVLRHQVSFLEQLWSAIKRIRLPMNPNSTVRLVWDFVGLFLISWDVLYIPFELAFDPEENPFIVVVGWIILLYWTCDVVMSNLVGFYEEGELVMNQRRIILRYLRTWFLIDLIVLGPDWFLRLWTGSSGGDPGMAIQNRSSSEGEMEDVANALRSIRVLRVVRLLRLLKVQRLMNLVYDILDSEYIFILFTLLKLTCLISVLNHVIACMWYGVGYITMENNERNWLENTNWKEDKESRVIDCSMVYQYTTALHWSLTQFTPASMDSFARNVPERILSIVVVFFALIGFSSIVGSVTNSVAQLQALHGNSRRQFWLLRKYLNEKGIYEPTRTRLFSFLEHEVERRRKDIKEEDVRLLSLLSSPLQNLLAYELHRGPMTGHPFFSLLDQHMQPVMYSLCHTAMKFKHFAMEDMCFVEAEGGKFMWVLIEGSFSYIRAANLYKLSTPGTWLSEPVLWTSWWHRGNLEAASTSGQVMASPTAMSPVPASSPSLSSKGQHGDITEETERRIATMRAPRVEPLWHHHDRKAMKSGQRGTIYWVGKQILAEDGSKTGKVEKGASYQGEWDGNQKNGYGVQVFPNGQKYEGQWANGMRNGEGTLWVPFGKAKKLRKLYVGGWKDDKRHGRGTCFFSDGQFFQGDWTEGKMHGEGLLRYSNGDLYIGEWLDGLRSGQGTLTKANGDCYEGYWLNDMREGSGSYFYAQSGKVFVGEWVNDLPKAGVYTQANSNPEQATPVPQTTVLPQVMLAFPNEVLEGALAAVREVQKIGASTRYEAPEISLQAESLEMQN